MVSDSALNHSALRQKLCNISSLCFAAVWNSLCICCPVLRITQSLTNKDVLKLEGRLAGPWVEVLETAAREASGRPTHLQIDVEDLTYADEDGEIVLCRLDAHGVRFQGKSPFSEFLFGRLKIPLSSRKETFGGDD